MQGFSKTKLFYFSGTGNSFRIAKQLSDKLSDCALIPIQKDTSTQLIQDGDVVGLVFPVYYFGFPEVVELFLHNMRCKNISYLFIVATRGVPIAGGLRNQLIKITSGNLSYFQYITMGDNFNLDFWNSSSNKVRLRRNKNSDREVEKIALAISRRKVARRFTLVDYLWVLTKYAPRYGYQTYKKKVLRSDNCFDVDAQTCIQCNKCINFCPMNNIIRKDTIHWLQVDCQLCLACYHCCPVNAIQYKNDFLTTKGKTQYWNY